MGKNTLLAMGGGGLSAAASLALVLGTPGGVLLAYVTPLPLLLVGLGLGTNAAALAASVGLIVVTLAGGVTAAGIYGGMHALPSWLLVHQVLSRQPPPAADPTESWQPIGHVVATLAAIAALVAVATALAAADDEGVEAAIRSLLLGVTAVAAPDLEEERRALLVSSLAPVFLGFSALNWQLMILVNAAVAQTALHRRGRALRPTPRWSRLSLPDWLSWMLVAAAAVALVADGDAGYVARNTVIALCGPFFLAGLAIVHRRIRTLRTGRLVLFVFYALLLMFFAVVAAAVAGLGMLSQWSRSTDVAAPADVEKRE